MATMTNREFLNVIVASDMAEDVIAHATELLEKMDAKNAKRSSTPSKTQVANESVKASILEWLKDKDFTITKDIAEGVEESPNKVGALCRQMRDKEILLETEVKIPKVGIRKAYKVAE